MTRDQNRSGAALCMAALLALSGCTSDPSPAPLPSGSQSAVPSATQDAADTKARTDVLAAYDGFQRALQAALTSGDYQSKDLVKFTAEPLLGQTRNSIYQLKQAGLKGKGQRRWSPQVVDLQLEQKTPTATIEDCTDNSKWTVVSTKTGKPMPAPSGRPAKYLVTSTAKKVSGTWYVSEQNGDWARPC